MGAYRLVREIKQWDSMANQHATKCLRTWFESWIEEVREGSVSQFSRSVVSNSLWPHGMQHSRLPWPSPTPRACSNSCPSCQWCHPTISSSVVPFFSCLQSFPASGSFPMSQLFASGGQSIKSLSFNISPSNEHPGLISFRMNWLDLLAVQGMQEPSPTPQFKSISSPALSFLKSHIHTWLLEKP